MRKLIVTTAKRDNIFNDWLPSLLKNGKYDGDILLIDYGDFGEEKVPENVKIVKTQKVYKCIPSDRIRAFYEALKDIWQNYDVILITDGGDVLFQLPLQPLFDLAAEKICYVKENLTFIHWIMFKWTSIVDKKVWDVLGNEKIINAGMFIGPSKMIFETTKFITEGLAYASHFGAEQVLLNALIYYYKTFPSQEVDNTWNYDGRLNHYTKNGKFLNDKYSVVAIFHNIGTSRISERDGVLPRP